MIKKIIILTMIFNVLIFGFIIFAGVYVQTMATSIFASNAQSAEDKVNELCAYTGERIVFDPLVEMQREQVEKKIPPYMVNATLGIYALDTNQDIKEIIKKMNDIVKKHYSNVPQMIQTYKYGSGYDEYLNSISEKHSLSTSRKYFNEKYENKEAEPQAYAYFMHVLGQIDSDCEMIATDGTWTTPLKKPFSITQDFLLTNPAWGDVHYGIDMTHTYGDTLYAVTDAKVYKVGTGCAPDGGYLGNMCNYGSGNFVTLLVNQGDKNVYIFYLHMKEIVVNEGDEVVVGQKVGYLGHSGNSTGAHVHLEFRSVPHITRDDKNLLNPHDFIDFYKEEGE